MSSDALHQHAHCLFEQLLMLLHACPGNEGHKA